MIWWVLALFLAGVTLITVEFIVPGGICGSVGALMVIGSTGLGIYHYPDQWLPILMLEFLGTIASVILGMYLLPRSPFGKMLVLGDSQKAEEGWVNQKSDGELIGKIGKVVTPLRPVGTVELGPERLQAVSEGAFIDRGEEVRVIEVHGNRIVVEKTEQAEETAKA